MHGKLTEGAVTTRKVDRKFMEGSVASVNIDGLSCGCRESSWKLTKNPSNPRHAESLRKLPWIHKNVIEVDKMPCRRIEIRWKFKPMHGKLTTGLVDPPKVVGS